MTDESLINLKVFLQSSLANQSENTIYILKRIHSYCLNAFNYPRIHEILKETFNNEPKLLEVCNFSEDKVSHEIVEYLCDFIMNMIVHAKEKFLPFCILVKKYLVGILNFRKSTSKMKELSLKTLQRVLSLTANTELEMEVTELLIELFGYLQNKPTLTVLAADLELLGKISFLYPHSFISHSSEYERITLNHLTNEITSTIKSSSTSTISGCCEGLRFYYSSLPPDDRNNKIPVVYTFLLKILQMDPGKRFAAVKSCLHFFTDHWNNLVNEIFNDIEVIFHHLSTLSKHYNFSLKYCAQECMDSFLAVVGRIIHQKSLENSLTNIEKSAFDFLLCKFTENIKKIHLSNETPSKIPIDNDIKGFGHLVKCCSVLLPQGSLETLFALIGDHIWKEFYLEKGEEQVRLEFENSKIYRIIDILNALINMLDGLLETHQFELMQYQRKTEIITRLTHILIEFFPRISSHKINMYKKVFSMIINTLKPYKSVSNVILEEIVYHAIIFSCSFPVPRDYSIIRDFSVDISDSQISHENGMEPNDVVKSFAGTSVRDFLPFWNIILKSDSSDDQVVVAVFDAFIECSLKIIDRLDLSYKTLLKDNEKINTDPMTGKSACTPKDFVVFVNICELFQFAMFYGHDNKIAKWSSYCINLFVSKSLELPLVSGFYKLIGSIIKVLQSASCFDLKSTVDMDIEMSHSYQDSIICDIKRLTCSMLEKMCNYNDELLITCLTLLVNVPVVLWIHNDDALHELGGLSYIKLAIELGNSYLPLGHAALDMLEQWIRALPVTKTWIHSLLPSFRALLSYSENTSSDVDDTHQKQLKGLVSARRDNRNLARVLRFIQETEQRHLSEQMECGVMSYNSTKKIEQLQNRFIRILGDLGIQHSRYFVKLDNNKWEKDINWNKSSRAIIPYSVPFEDIKPQIRLECFLSSLCSLALDATNCQTKSLAAEVLHAVILITVGKSESALSPPERDKLLPAWAHIFTISIKLATDMNKVCKVLFSDLLFQMAYWYSYPHKAQSLDTQCFIDCMFNTIICVPNEEKNQSSTSDTNSGNLKRDLAGRILCYMLESSFDHDEMKKKSSKILEVYNMQSILDRVYGLFQNFSPFKRLGAIFILNSMFPVMMKDKQFLKNEIFVILYYLINCQRLSENDKNLGTLLQLEYAFINVEKIIMLHKTELKEYSENRKLPPSWNQATLEFAIRWLLNHFLSDQRRFRQKCINLSGQLAACYEENSPRTFFKALYNAKKSEYFINKFENLEILNSNPIREIDKRWMNSLEASLQAYLWLLQMDVIVIEEYFSNVSISRLFAAINSFLDCYSNCQQSRDFLCLSANLTRFLALILSRSDRMSYISELIAGSAMIDFLAFASIQCYRLDLDIRNKKKVEKWIQEIKSLITGMKENIRELYLTKISDSLSNYTFSSDITVIKDSTGRMMNLFEIEYLFKSLKLLCVVAPKCNLIANSINESLFQEIIKSSNYEDNQKSQIRVVQSSILDYLFSVNSKVYIDGIIAIIIKKEMQSLLNTHEKVILKNMFLHPMELVDHLNKDKLPSLLPILLKLLEHGIKNNDEEKSSMVSVLVEQWATIVSLKQISFGVDQAHLSSVFKLLLEMILIDSKVCANQNVVEFYCRLLSSSSLSLKFKNEIIPNFTHVYRYSTLAENSSVQIINNLQTFVTTNFPAVSKEFSSDILLNDCYVTTITTMLKCLQVPVDVNIHLRLLRTVVIPIFCREASHPMDQTLQKYLTIFCNRLCPVDKITLLSVLENELTLLTSYDNIMWLLDKFYLVSILQCDNHSLNGFFFSRISSLKECLQSANIEELKENQFKEMRVNIEIINTIYKSLGAPKTVDKSGLRDSKVISDLSKRCSSIVFSKPKVCPSGSIDLIIFNIRSRAFSCLSSIVIATQTDEKFYLNLLLKPNRPLFQNIISLDQFQKFPNNNLIQKTKKIQFFTHHKRKSTHQNSRPFWKNTQTQTHVMSQFLADSSLSFDVDKLESILVRNTNVELADPESRIQSDGRFLVGIDVPDDPVNNHVCMSTFVFLLNHMNDLGFINEIITTADTPQWMQLIRESLLDPGSCVDIKYFISKIILNCHDIFKPYASLWIPGLIDLISLTQTSINPYAASIITIIIQCSTVDGVINNVSKSDINKLIKFIAENCFYENAQITRINLDLFTRILQHWSVKIDIPYKPIFDNLQNIKEGMRNNCGLQMLAIVLTNGYSFMSGANNETKSGFIKQLAKNLRHKCKAVYGPAFELCGVILKQTINEPKSENVWIVELEQEITSALEFVFTRNVPDYLTCVALISKNCSSCIRSQLPILISTLKSLDDSNLCKGLEILGNETNTKEEWMMLFNQLHHLTIFENIQFRSGLAIQTLIKIIHQTVTNVQDWKSNPELNDVVMKSFEFCLSCCKHEERDIRAVFYQLFVDLSSDGLNNTTETSIRTALLNGLIDPDIEISQSVRNFCSSSKSLPTETLSRAYSILEVLFPCSSSDSSANDLMNMSKFLAIATNILLEMTSHSPDFIKPLFENHLDNNAVFEVLSATRMSSQTSRSLIPNFVISNTDISNVTVSHDQMFKIPTSINIPKKTKNFDWIKLASTLQYQNDTVVLNASKNDLSMEWSSSQIPGVEMFITIQSQGSLLSLPKPTIEKETQNEEVEDNHESSLYSRYFENSQNPEIITKRNSDFYRHQTIEKQKFRDKKQLIEQNLNKSAVFLYRNYHTGKLPDIQIQNSSVIAPLQMLAQFDENFSRELFHRLYNGLILESSSMACPIKFKQFCVKLSECFNNILNMCTFTDKNLAASCLQIAIDNIGTLSLNPDIIYKAGNLTDNDVLATMLLENYLNAHYKVDITGNRQKEPPAKKKKTVETDSINAIVPFLMKLYKGLNLNEEIIGLLNIELLPTNNSLISTFRNALEADCIGNYPNSFKLYNTLLSPTNDSQWGFKSELLSIAQKGLINCLEKLCKWSELSSFLDKLIEDTSHVPNNTVIKSIIHSKLRISILGLADYSGAMTGLQESVSKFQIQCPNFELVMPMDMSIFHIAQENYQKAQYFCDIAYNNVLTSSRDFSLSDKKDIQMLQNLQLLSEMSEFLQRIQTDKNELDILEIWRQRTIDPDKDSIEFWEKLLLHRTCYFTKFKSRLPSLSQELDDNLFDLQLQFIDACISQDRATPALNYLKYCRDISFKRGHDSQFAWILKYAKVWLRSARCHGNFVSVDDVSEIMAGITNSIKQFEKISDSDIERLTRRWEYFQTLGDCYWSIENISQCHWATLAKSKMRKSLFKLSCVDNDGSKELLMKDLSQKSYHYLEKTLTMYNEIDNHNDRQQLSVSLMVLSDFCDAKISESRNTTDDNNYLITSGIIKNYVESSLYSMKLGQFSAKNKFPRVLQVIAQYKSDEVSFNSFVSICSIIPSWMFIPWLDQMMSYLFSDNHPIVDSIIGRIAVEYPHSLFYPFRLQVADLSDLSSVVKKIQKQLSSLYLMDQFYNSLHQMGQPEDHLQNWLEEASDLFRSGPDRLARSNIVLKYQALYRNIFEDSEVSDPTSNIKKSQFQREFCDRFRLQLVDNFQEDGAAIYNLSEMEFMNIKGKIFKELNEWKNKGVETKNLNHFSPWLAKYNIRDSLPNSISKDQNWLEVPGQYNNINSRPFPEKHIKIFKLDLNIEIIKSKQRPKKIRIIGDNEQNYCFLVKSGEDLRQDYRLEQMFHIMNDILSRDGRLMRNMKLSMLLVTFNVIPISKRIGLLEWIDNTITLQSFLFKTISREEEQKYLEISGQFYSRFPTGDSYTESWTKPDVEEVNNLFEQHQRTVSQFDLLRRSFMIISKSHESFYRLRIKFIQQYAVMAAAHYILGVGDRHLGNFLIDESTGNVVGIDFGYAFGMSSILLPIPELIPFRLTSSIIQFFKPSGVEGMFSQTLDGVLKTLCNEQATIMSIMHVFLSNQIIDWARMSRIHKQSVDSFTHRRIDISRRKLKQEDPYLLLLEEIDIKHFESTWFKCFKNHQSDFEPKSQSKQLICMASNVGFLSRTWKGFAPLL